MIVQNLDNMWYYVGMAVNTPLKTDLPKYEVIEYEGRPARLYADGSLRNERGQLLAPAPNAAPPITTATARDMVRIRKERKHAVVQKAANEAVQSGHLRGQYGDMAFMAEVTQAQMTIATTPDAGKAATIAAEWLVNHSGMGEKQAEDEDRPIHQVAQRAADIVLESIWRDVIQARNTVDADVIPMRSDSQGDT